jgi:hypothetical protein
MKECAPPGAAGAEQCHDLASLDVQAYLGQDRSPGKALFDSLDVQATEFRLGALSFTVLGRIIIGASSNGIAASREISRC